MAQRGGANRRPEDAQDFLRRFRADDLAPVYVIFGREPYFAARVLEKLKEAVLSRSGPESIVSLDEKADFRDLLNAVRTRSLFGASESRLVILRDADAFLKEHGQQLAQHLAKPVQDAVLAITCQKWNGRSALAKAVGKVGVVLETRRVYPNRLVSWLCSEAHSMGKRLWPDAAELLVEASGRNLLVLRSELEKLSACVGDKKEIGVADVSAICNMARPAEIFELTDAVAGHDVKKALGAVRELLKGSASERVLPMLAWQWRRLWAAHQVRRSGGGPEDLAAALGSSSGSTFPMRVLLQQASRFKEGELRRKTRLLLEADVESKTTAQDSHSYARMIEGLVMRLCA